MNPNTLPRPIALIVEDHEAVRRALRECIEASFRQFTLREASSVDEALKIVEAENVDLVLMDFRLPGRDGVAGTREVLARSPGTTVVMVSGFDDFSHRSAASKAGVRAFVSKRAISRELVPTIASVVNAAAA
jgi:DNA-binding NarL/FixJ family response regulator